jgi:hypothetical protein
MAVLAEKRIGGFRQSRFPTRHRARQLGVQFKLSMKIEGVSVETVFARHSLHVGFSSCTERGILWVHADAGFQVESLRCLKKAGHDLCSARSVANFRSMDCAGR